MGLWKDKQRNGFRPGKGPKPSIASMPRVVLAIPTYDGKVCLSTMKSIIQDTLVMLSKGWHVSSQSVIGSADIYDARANACHTFLETQGTHLMFVDADVAWDQGAIPRLISHGLDLVAGVYPRRTEPFSYNLQYIDDREVLETNEKGVCEVAGVSGGFMCISRACLERMTQAYRDDPVAGLAIRPGGTYPALFDPYRFKDNPQRKFGEDYAFCQRWRDLGGKVWIDPHIAMSHTGQKTYTAKLADHMKTREAAA